MPTISIRAPAGKKSFPVGDAFTKGTNLTVLIDGVGTSAFTLSETDVILNTALAANSLVEISTVKNAIDYGTTAGNTTSAAIRGAGARVPTLAVFGDSVTASTAQQNTALLTYNAQRGMQYWVPFLSGRRLRSRPDLNFGVSGNTSAQGLARLQSVVNSDADVVIVQFGRNDIGVLTLAQTQANLRAIWDSLLDAGKLVYALPPLPSSLATQANRDALWAIVHWVKSQYAYRRNMVVIDTELAYVDPLSATSDPKTGFSYDGLHPTARGEYYTSLKVVQDVTSRFPPPFATFSNASDAYSATNPLGNLLTNGILSGTLAMPTAGLVGGAGAGNIATSWSVSYSANGGTISGLTTTGTKLTDANGRPGQRIAVSGSYTGAGSAAVNASTQGLYNQAIAFPGSLVAGDVIRARCEISKAAAATENITGLELQVVVVVGGVTYRIGDGSSMGDPLPVDAFSGILETPTFTLPGTPTSVTVYLRWYLANGAQTVNSSFDFYGMKLAKVG